jgi:hypothetical protein
VRGWRTILLAISISCGSTLACGASAPSCRNFAREAQAAFAKEVMALRQFEREAADRLKGLDSRPFRFMRDEAVKATAVIADADRLKDEALLEKCANATRPIRRICAGSAQLLVAILDKHVANAAPDYDKPQYAAAMAECETLLGLKPLTSRIRGNE